MTHQKLVTEYARRADSENPLTRERDRHDEAERMRPAVDHVVAWHGLQDDQMALRQALMAEGPSALERVTSDELVRAFSITGTPDECRAQYKAYSEVLPGRTVLLHTPYVPPLTREESADAYRSIIDAFGGEA